MDSITTDMLLYAQKKIELDGLFTDLDQSQRIVDTLQSQIAARQAELAALLEKIQEQ